MSENLRTKVMLVEDDVSMLTILKTLLEFEGFQTVAVERDQEIAGVADIIDKIRHERPGLLLLDVYFRQINGLDVLRSLRKDPELNQIRVLISSGMDHSGESKQEGADDFLLKPYMPEDLIQRIRELVGV